VLRLPLVVLGLLPLRRHLGALRLLPLLAALDADALEEFRGGCDVGVLLPPLRGQVTPEGGGQEGLTKLLDEWGDGLEGTPGPAAALCECLDLGDAAAPLVWGRDQQRGPLERCSREVLDRCSREVRP